MRILYYCVIVFNLSLLLGCATPNEFMCGPIEAEILSDPSGASISINDKLIGTTPLKVNLERECVWHNYNAALEKIIIKAEPSSPRQFIQYKVIGLTDTLPRRIIFHMYEKPSIPLAAED